MLQAGEKLTHSPVVKILSSSCFPRKRRGGSAYTPPNKVGTEKQSFTTEVYRGSGYILGWWWDSSYNSVRQATLCAERHR